MDLVKDYHKYDMCWRCDELTPKPDSDEFPFQRDNCLGVYLQGGYAMFHDCFETQCVQEAYLCHDCAVELYRFLKFDPQTDPQYRGLHPYENEFACCEYGWGAVYENGKWEGAITYGFDPSTIVRKN